MKQGIEALGRVRLQGFALLAVAFLAGGLTGGAIERVRSARPARPHRAAGPLQRPGGLPPWLGRLDLSETQEERVRAVLERRRVGTDSVFRNIRSRISIMADSVNQEIRNILTPEQRKRLEREGPPARWERRRRPDRRPGPQEATGPPP